MLTKWKPQAWLIPDWQIARPTKKMQENKTRTVIPHICSEPSTDAPCSVVYFWSPGWYKAVWAFRTVTKNILLMELQTMKSQRRRVQSLEHMQVLYQVV